MSKPTDLSPRVRALVAAARVYLYEDPDAGDLVKFDQALEAFAADIPWDKP